MKKLTMAALAVAGLALVSPAMADDLTGANKFLCSAATTAACCDDGECASGTAGELNIPQFLEIDMAAKKISSTKASGRDRSSTVVNLLRQDGTIVLQGLENGRAYSIKIDEKTGELSAAVAATGCGITVFGLCTPLGGR